MLDYKIYFTGKIIHLELTDSKKGYCSIFVFKNESQAIKFKKSLEEYLNLIKSPGNLEKLISRLDYETLINHKDLEIMEAANNNLPGFYKTALKDNISKIYLGASFS